MRYFSLFLIFIMLTIAVFCLVKETSGGTIDELYAIAQKYMENPIVAEDHGNHICVYVLSKDKKEVIAVDVRTPDLEVCLYFFEKIDGVMKLVWTNPEIEKERKKKLDNRSVNNV